MHIYFSGIGGTGIGPLSLIAHQAGHTVSGSDKQASSYIEYLRSHGINDIHIGQDYAAIETSHNNQQIDWYVYSSAVMMEQPDAPEFAFCREHNIRMTSRNELINFILEDKKLKMIAIAGTHGKTTTTAMAIWIFKQLNIPVSYSVGAKMSFGDMGSYEPSSEYFVYEADEFARNFLAFKPKVSLISGVDWDHPDIYPTRDDYNDAFRTFIGQSDTTYLWRSDADRLGLDNNSNCVILDEYESDIDQSLHLPGHVNRLDAWQVAQSLGTTLGRQAEELIEILNTFPGVSRRFERIAPNLYSDYAHTPPKIRGALQIAKEVGNENVIVVYEGLHNTRQHFIKDELHDLFNSVKHVYVAPSYLAREDETLELLTPGKLIQLMSEASSRHATVVQLDINLKQIINEHLQSGDVVLCLSAGGGGSLDEWLRINFDDVIVS